MEISSSCRIYNNNTQADAANQILGPVAGPLQEVVACLSGQDQHKKEELHMLILSLGGRYVIISIRRSALFSSLTITLSTTISYIRKVLIFNTVIGITVFAFVSL